MGACREGGASNNLISRVFVLSAAVIILACNAETPVSESSQWCIEGILEASVAKVDEENFRFFIAGKKLEADSIADNIVHLCALQCC